MEYFGRSKRGSICAVRTLTPPPNRRGAFLFGVPPRPAVAGRNSKGGGVKMRPLHLHEQPHT